MPKNNQWINLHSHDIWSLLDGYGRQEQYAARAIELGQPALATTNHGNLFGIYKHYKTCLEFGIKPILGIEAYRARKTRHDRDSEELSGPSTTEWGQRGPHHQTILAKNNIGYQNLMKLSSESFLTGYYGKGRIDFEVLSDCSDGLIVLSGCLSGMVCQALLRGDFDGAVRIAATDQEVVGKENYFIEIMNHGIEEELRVLPDLLRVAEKIGAKVVPTQDTHYVHKDDHDSHDTMLCLGTRSLKAQEERFRFAAGPQFYLKSYDEMSELFEAEHLANTLLIGEMCDINLEFNDLHFPKFPDTPEGMTADQFFVDKAWEGMRNRFGDNIPDEYMNQAEYELSTIREMGFQEYFLVVQDLIGAGKANGVNFNGGRGSAAGCLVSYAMGITGLDPLKFELLFERFLTPPEIEWNPDFTPIEDSCH